MYYVLQDPFGHYIVGYGVRTFRGVVVETSPNRDDAQIYDSEADAVDAANKCPASGIVVVPVDADRPTKKLPIEERLRLLEDRVQALEDAWRDAQTHRLEQSEYPQSSEDANG